MKKGQHFTGKDRPSFFFGCFLSVKKSFIHSCILDLILLLTGLFLPSLVFLLVPMLKFFEAFQKVQIHKEKFIHFSFFLHEKEIYNKFFG
jgi:hypothetical protein